MNGAATTESGVPVLVGRPDSREFQQGARTSDGRGLRQVQGLPTHKDANPFTWLHIKTHNHTRKVEE